MGRWAGWCTRRVRPIAIAIISGVVLLAVLGTTGFAASVTWSGLRGALVAGDPSLAAWVALVLFVGMFAGSLVLIGLTAAWRMAIWTVDAATSCETGRTGRSGESLPPGRGTRRHVGRLAP